MSSRNTMIITYQKVENDYYTNYSLNYSFFILQLKLGQKNYYKLFIFKRNYVTIKFWLAIILWS